MPPRKLFLMTLALVAALAVVAACGGGDDDDGGSTDHGQLTDPQTVPTVTPWQQLPEPIILDPNNIQPLPPTDPNSGGSETTTPTPVAGEPGVCGETYTVESGDTTFGIADKCGVDAQAIIDANPDIDAASLSPGDVLIMPAPSDESAEETADAESQ